MLELTRAGVNGVDTEALNNTVAAIEESPNLAAFEFRVANQWLAGGQNRSTIRSFFGAGKEDDTREKVFVMDADEPRVLLGADAAANPAEYMLHALAACMTTTMAYHAAAQGIEIEGIESEVSGRLDLRGFLGLDPSIPTAFQSINVTFRVRGSEAAAQKLEDLTKFSPIFGTVTQPVPVTVRVMTEPK